MRPSFLFVIYYEVIFQFVACSSCFFACSFGILLLLCCIDLITLILVVVCRGFFPDSFVGVFSRIVGLVGVFGH